MKFIIRPQVIMSQKEFNRLSEELRQYIENNLYMLHDDFHKFCNNKYDYELWEEVNYLIIDCGSVDVKIK
ncbi:MAG: hypothetical protein DRP62_01570 [Planctomycetota bacterium]|nr:MAG: hypothetical protein DRP62_01570 [Planctomycetota bacterium]